MTKQRRTKRAKVNYTDLIHTCTAPNCLKEGGIEALIEERGDRIEVLCGLCGRRRDYPAEALNRESPALVAENMRRYFAVTERFGTG